MLHCPRNIMRTVAYSGCIFGDGLALRPWPRIQPAIGGWRTASPIFGLQNAMVACGARVAWEKTPGGRDKNNPDVSKQNRPTLGMPILIDMKKKPGVDHGKAKSITPRTDSSTVRRSSRSVPINWRSRAACWASSAAVKPGPASPVRFPPAPPTAWPRARRRPRVRYPARPHRTTSAAATKTTGPSTRPQNTGSKAGGRPAGRSGRRYLSTPRHRAVCPLAPAGTTAPRQAW